MEKLIAYHGKKKIKKFYIDRVKKHTLAGNLIKGQYWEGGKGCGIGCTLESNQHSQYPIELGIPEMLARLEDVIFEGLPNGTAKMWPVRFLRAVNIGSDLSMVGPKFLLAITKRRYEKLDTKGKELVGSAIEQVIKVLADWVEFGKVDEKAAESAASAARSAARSAESAASAAWSAESAASAARSAASAAWSAASAVSATWSAARSAEYVWMADKLIELIKETK